MRESFRDGKGESRFRPPFRAFANTSGAEGAPPPLLKSSKFSERMAELRGLQVDADKESGRSDSEFIKSYIVVPDGEGGQKLQRVEPFNGDQAGVRNSGFTEPTLPLGETKETEATE